MSFVEAPATARRIKMSFVDSIVTFIYQFLLLNSSFQYKSAALKLLGNITIVEIFLIYLVLFCLAFVAAILINQ